MIDIVVIFKDNDIEKPYFGFFKDFPGICASAESADLLKGKLRIALIEFIRGADLNTSYANPD